MSRLATGNAGTVPLRFVIASDPEKPRKSAEEQELQICGFRRFGSGPNSPWYLFCDVDVEDPNMTLYYHPNSTGNHKGHVEIDDDEEEDDD